MSDEIRGRLLWAELLARDPEAAATFYPAVTGWTTATFPGTDPPYTMFVRGETPIGGIHPLPPDAESGPMWLPYFGVPDVDAAAIRAQEEGARVHLPSTDIPNVGRFSVLADPFGASFAVYRPESGAASGDAEPEVGEVSWLELATRDVARAVDFYGELFAWSAGAVHEMGDEGAYQLLERDGRPFGGVVAADSSDEAPAWRLYLRSGDLEGSLARVKERGGTIVRGPMEVPGGDRVALCADPQGAAFAFHEIRGA